MAGTQNNNLVYARLRSLKAASSGVDWRNALACLVGSPARRRPATPRHGAANHSDKQTYPWGQQQRSVRILLQTHDALFEKFCSCGV